MNGIFSLIEKIGNLIEKNNEISRLKGETFNIFSILELETKENTLHSRFLKELLDIKGSHGLGTVFLDLFIKYLNENIYKDIEFETSNSLVVTEKSMGTINLTDKTGGRIDISIKNNKSEIIIENKIYAIEQNSQIERYCNYAKNNNATVFYLTLHGKPPTTSGEFQLNSDYFTLSYSNDIINWLELCKMEVSDYPIIRETIKQYIIILKKLTGQLIDNAMNQEVKIQILGNYDAAKQIQAGFEDIKNDVLIFWNEVRNRIYAHHIVLEKNWKVGVNNSSVVIDVLGHDRNNLNAYIENISSKPYNCIWINKTKYNKESLNQYIRTLDLKWDSSENYLLKDPFLLNFKEANTLLKIYNSDEKENLIKEIVEKSIHFALENEKHLIEINKFKIQ